MAGFTLTAEYSFGVTAVSNAFIDEYMCSANGEFVKIYLFLLRCLSQPREDFSLLALADKMNLTEGDILRALKYWEQQKLLKLTQDENGDIKHISLRNIVTPETPVTKAPKLQNTKPINTPAKNSSMKSISAPTENSEEIQELILIAEQYLKRTLSSMDLNRIMYFYEDLHFSADLIEYLFEHCVTIGNRNIRYIESVAISWADRGITTVEQAKAEGAHYKREYFTILKAFGVHNRMPIESEVQYMQKWLNEYHFTTEVICEACQRTISKIGNVSFKYADSILKNWSEHGILAKKDIHALDQAHYAQIESKKAEAKEKQGRQSRPSTKFSNFEQRNDYDFNQLEKQLNHT